jgi:hypothetical protein
MCESLGRLRVQPVCPQNTEDSRFSGCVIVRVVAAVWLRETVVVVSVGMVGDADSGESCVLEACMM